MLRGSLQTGGQGEKAGLVGLVAGENVGNHRFALGESSRLVQHHRVDAVEGLQSLGGFNQDTVFSTLAGTHHDGHGGGQPQSTGAGDDQHGHTGGEGLCHVIAAHKEPHQGSDGGNGHDHRDKYPGHLVCQLGDGSLGGGSLLHQSDHLGQGGVLAHPQGLKGEGAGAVHGGGSHLVPGPFVHREGLAGEGGLVYGGAALHHHAVYRDGLTGPDHNTVAHPNIFYGNLHL